MGDLTATREMVAPDRATARTPLAVATAAPRHGSHAGCGCTSCTAGPRPLDTGARQYFGARFAHDFSGVRVHTDDRAALAARALRARAFTIGKDVVFARGAYEPHTREGTRLLAHELTHVVQQSKGSPAPQTASVLSNRTDRSEQEADRVAGDVAAGRDAHVAQHSSAPIQGDWAAGAGIGALTGGVVGGLLGLALGGPLGALVGAGIGLVAGAVIGGLIQSRMRRGTWTIAQANNDGAVYSSDVDITFTPDPAKVDCDDIAFVQTVKFSDQSTGASVETIPNYVRRRTAAGWTLDRIDQRSYGWYGYNNDGRPSGIVTPGKSKPLTPAKLHDSPTDMRPKSTFEFETAAICHSGPNANQLLGTFRWGFDVDAANHLTSRPTSDTNAPSTEFNDAVKQWNLQAKGPAAARNDPAQQQLGPFRQ